MSYLDLNFNNIGEFRINYLWVSYLIFSLFIFGFRYQIGGDWNNYFAAFLAISDGKLNYERTPDFNPEWVNLKNFKDAIFFYLLNLFVKEIFNSFIVFNIICSVIFLYAMNKFCSTLKTGKFLAYGLFTSYLVIVVHLGYVRQSLAISFLALSLSYYLKGKNFKPYIYFILSFLTHIITSTFILIFINFKRKFLLLACLIFIILIVFFAWDKINLYYYYYLGDGIHFQSRRAFARVILNIPFFILLFLFKNQLEITDKEKLFFITCAVMLLICLFLVFTNATTLADRISLQLILFQGYVLGKIYNSLRTKTFKNLFISCSFIYSYSQFIGWVSTTKFITSWLPYKNIIFN